MKITWQWKYEMEDAPAGSTAEYEIFNHVCIGKDGWIMVDDKCIARLQDTTNIRIITD